MIKDVIKDREKGRKKKKAREKHSSYDIYATTRALTYVPVIVLYFIAMIQTLLLLCFK